jgi:hypothetical protein
LAGRDFEKAKLAKESPVLIIQMTDVSMASVFSFPPRYFQQETAFQESRGGG